MNKQFSYRQSFQLESGKVLPELTIAYSDYGPRDARRIIWVCHALSGSAQVIDWWPGLVGKDRLFDPESDRVICANVLGSCYGTSGPVDLDYPAEFPEVTIKDFVKAHQLLADELKLKKIDVLIGASLGGQQAVEWAVEQPARFDQLILIATNAHHSPYGIAFNEAQRLALKSDLTFGLKNGGKEGLKAARAIAMLSYRSYTDFELKQSEDSLKSTGYKAASYVRYQGEKFVDRFNPYSYNLLTKAMDSHDVRRGRSTSLQQVLEQIQARTLVVGIDSDTLFPISEQQQLAAHIPGAEFGLIESPHGHDSFLIDYDKLNKLLSEFLYNDFRQYKPTRLKPKTTLN
ncbi:MAG: homoserine O-acetyltransferase [Bacteroidetes bacterium]|nr:homoserine O-acetyltransferase [Bacteroidota bacterium]